jgi:membrane fusion protein (multidrug efflux system)
MREVPRISIRPYMGPACRRLVLGLLAAAIALGCNRAETKQGSTAPPPPTVGVAQVVQRTVPLVRDFVARTEAVPTVEIRARVAGVLEEVKFREGTEVEQNQILFVIQQAEYKAALQAARAQLAKAEADLTRAKDVSIVDRGRAHLDQANAELGKARQDVARYRPLAEAQAIPQQDLDTALSREQAAVANVEAATAAFKDTVLSQRTAIQLSEAAVESAKAAVTQAELNLAYTVVRTPIPGVISKLAVDTGNLVGKAEPTLLATVSALDPIYVDFSITEADYLRLVKRIPGLGRGAVRRDTPARLDLIVADATTFPHKGRPVFVDRAIDVKTGTIAVRAEFPNPQRVLRPGQFGRVRAVTEDVPNAVLVPQLAVQELQGAKTVFVVDEGEKVVARTVTLGDAIDDAYIVTAGLKPGERVIVEGIQKVRPGMKVTTQVVGTAPAGGGPGATPSASPASRPNTGS